MECTVAIPGFLKAWSASHTFLYSQTGKTLASLLFLVLCNHQPTYLPSPGLSFQENPQKVFLCNPKNIPLSLCKRPPSQTKISPCNSFSTCSPSQKKNLSVTSNKITSLSGNLSQLPLSGFSQATPFLFLQALLSAQKLPQPALLTCSPSSPKYLTSGHCPFFLLSQLDLSCSPVAARFLVLCFAHSSLASSLLPLTCSFFLLLSVSHPFHCSRFSEDVTTLNHHHAKAATSIATRPMQLGLSGKRSPTPSGVRKKKKYSKNNKKNQTKMRVYTYL